MQRKLLRESELFGLNARCVIPPSRAPCFGTQLLREENSEIESNWPAPGEEKTGPTFTAASTFRRSYLSSATLAARSKRPGEKVSARTGRKEFARIISKWAGQIPVLNTPLMQQA